MILIEIEKRPTDQFGHSIFYNNVFQQGEYISTCVLTAIRTSDSTDVASALLVSTSGTIPRFTATAGTTTSAKNAADAISLGFAVGDYVVNETKGFRSRVTDIRYASAKNDTLIYEEQAIATAVSDVISAQKAIVKLKTGGGANGDRVKITITTTTNLSNIFYDEIFVNVRTV